MYIAANEIKKIKKNAKTPLINTDSFLYTKYFSLVDVINF